MDLGDNVAAQLHAESALENCFSSHWGIDGLKPYMRYTLAGGYHYNAENLSGRDYCITARDGYAKNRSANHEIRQATDGLMNSPGHRRNILNKWHRKVNIGIAMDDYNFTIVQHFEGDYVDYSELPSITNGTLAFKGNVKHGVYFADERSLGVQIYYDPPVYALTRGQISRTYCLKSGIQIAGLRQPLQGNWYYDSDFFSRVSSDPACPDPYDVPPDAPPPKSVEESHDFWQQAYDASQINIETAITVPWITATEWVAAGRRFSIRADIKDLLAQHGDGVYTVIVWGEINGKDVPISKYSIFIPRRQPSQPTELARLTPTPSIATLPIRTSTPATVHTPALTATPTPLPTPISGTASGLTEDEISEVRLYILSRVNEVRTTNSLEPLTLDNNTAAQSHAEDMRANCFYSNWSSDGLKGYMRYSLAGGHQYASVYTGGYNYCPPSSEGYLVETVHQEMDDLMDSLLNNPGFLDDVLDPKHRRVSFGIADQQPSFWYVHQFVTDFVTYDDVPAINDQILSLSGHSRNGAVLSDEAFAISIDYDQSPRSLTRGQLRQASCPNNGMRIGGLRKPLEPGWHYNSDTYSISGERCLDPYNVPANAPVAQSYDDEVPRVRLPYQDHAYWITAKEWGVTDESFSVTADIGTLLDRYGDGVYTIIVWALVNGEEAPISKYSIFIPPYEPAP